MLLVSTVGWREVVTDPNSASPPTTTTLDASSRLMVLHGWSGHDWKWLLLVYDWTQRQVLQSFYVEPVFWTFMDIFLDRWIHYFAKEIIGPSK